jgi:3-oxoacyl-[acyl-carrier protein] reductase
VLVRFIAIDSGPVGVGSNYLAPETIMTEPNKAQVPSQVQEQLIQNHPIRRLATPEDLAAPALYLISDESSWITGTVLDGAGGSVLAWVRRLLR